MEKGSLVRRFQEVTPMLQAPIPPAAALAEPPWPESEHPNLNYEKLATGGGRSNALESQFPRLVGCGGCLRARCC